MPDVPVKSVFGTDVVLPLPGTTGEVDADEHSSTNQALKLLDECSESLLSKHSSTFL